MTQMMLSKNFDERKIDFPGYISRKFDGVPGGYSREKLVSRQGKPLLGVQWIHDLLSPYIPNNVVLWGEHYEAGKPFKYISGKVRKNEPYTGACLYLFNLHDKEFPNSTFRNRIVFLKDWFHGLPIEVRAVVGLATQYYVDNPTSLDSAINDIKQAVLVDGDGQFEGCMYHSSYGMYFPGTRSWGSMKIVNKPLIDLRIVGILESVSEEGEPKGMVGSMLCEDGSGQVFTVAAGKLSHSEREEMFEAWPMHRGTIVKVKHKGDSTYEGLREPTFQEFNLDKDTPDNVPH